jgi:nitroreductase
VDLAELIKSRRSTPNFHNRPLPDGLVEELLDIAVWAPNHHVTEPWRFILISGDGRLPLAELHRRYAEEGCPVPDLDRRRRAGEREFEITMDVPAYLAVVMRNQADPEKQEEDFAACCCLIQNFNLLAWERGLGVHWLSFWHEPRHMQLLKLDADEKVVGLLRLGYPAKVPPGKARTPGRTRLAYIREPAQAGWQTPVTEGEISA